MLNIVNAMKTISQPVSLAVQLVKLLYCFHVGITDLGSHKLYLTNC
ncbi:hypothetical protein SAMN04488513_102141 [Pseudozobellia thermophila]|uniref:Uncharacterized protein n=1 Tax=Pseudozobellia thermophila TaxID=192903 RepID=A0A1M6EQC2_9FLAO|nr:hypothetical protein SAMN04488513_102141 [Pseudozobellia thermophila]